MSQPAYRLTLIGPAEDTPPVRIPGTVRGLLSAEAAARSWLLCHPEHVLVTIAGARTGNFCLNVWRSEKPACLP